jgi:NADH-quinone oxidoreductase subunit E
VGRVTFDGANREKAKQIVSRYPFARSAVLPLLHLALEQDGWVSPEAIDEVAGMVGIEPAQVLGTCSFYTMFKRDGKKHLVVSVCTNVSCLVNGGPELFEALSEQYSATEDVHVEEVECLAACDTAPVFQVNYEFHGNTTPEAASTIIDEYRSGTRVPRGVSGGKRT